MTADDSNDTRGAAGECPGHEWEVAGIYLRTTGGSMSVKCSWCGAVQYEPSLQD